MNESISAKKAHVARQVRKPHRAHHCHARNCGRSVPPAYFMCTRHWRMVPYALQRQVWAHYNAGQEDGNADVSQEYLRVTDEAIAIVDAKEAKPA